MPLKLYAHPVSQPSRALMWLMALLKIPYELVVTVIPDAQRPEYLDKFPFGALPGLEIIDEKGGPSKYISDYLAIATYLCDNHGGDAGKSFYPADPITRAHVLSLTVQAQTGFRHTCTADIARPLIFAAFLKHPCTLTKEQLTKALSPDLEGRIVDLSRAVGWTKAAHDGTRDPVVDEAATHPFVAGAAPTIADLLLFAEIVQVDLIGALGDICSRRPAFAKWIEKMKALPGYEQIHAPVKGFFETAEFKANIPV